MILFKNFLVLVLMFIALNVGADDSVFKINERVFVAPSVTIVDFKSGSSSRLGNVEFTVPSDAKLLFSIDCTESPESRAEKLRAHQLDLMAKAKSQGRAISTFGPSPVDYCSLM